MINIIYILIKNLKLFILLILLILLIKIFILIINNNIELIFIYKFVGKICG